MNLIRNLRRGLAAAIGCSVFALAYMSAGLCAQTGTRETVAPGACPTDGSSTAPAGVPPLYPNLLNGYAHAPTCKFAEVGYGTGAYGLGTPVVTSAATAPGDNVLHFAATAGYAANGLAIKDLSNPHAIAPTATVASFNGASITMSAGAAGAGVAAGDAIALVTTIDNYTPPSGISKNTGTPGLPLLVCSGPNATIQNVDLSEDGGWEIYAKSGCTNLTIRNVFATVGANGLDPINITASATGGGSISYVSVDGNSIDDGKSQSSLIIIAGTGSWMLRHIRCMNANSDCYDADPTGSLTIDAAYLTCLNWGSGFLSGAHADCVQQFQGTITPTWRHMTVYDNSTTDGTQIFGCGDNHFTVNCINPTFTDELVMLPNTYAQGPPVSGFNFVCQGDLAQTTGVASCTNSFMFFTATSIFEPSAYKYANSGGAKDTSGNINLSTGAPIN